MTLLFADSFDHYAWADVNKKWDAVYGSNSLISTGGARHGSGYRTQSYGNRLRKNIAPATNTLIMGAAVQMVSAPSFFGSRQYLFMVGNGDTWQADLFVDQNGFIGISRSGTVLATSTKQLIAGQNYFIEWKIQVANVTSIACSIRVNSEQWVSLAAGADTQNDTVATVNTVSIGQISASPSSNDITFDNFYLCDSGGSSCNDFLGEIRIDPYLPNADGTYTALTPSTGTSHFALVDETTPNTTDYNESAVAGNKDTYQFADMAHTPVSIFAVQLNVAAHKDDSGARSIKTVTRSGGTDYVNGTAEALATTQRYYREIREVDPATGVAWTKTNLNAAEFGVEVV